MQRLLFIGNGFDIAHNKCTKYMDFLYACAKLINKNDFEYHISDDYKVNLDKTTNAFISKYQADVEVVSQIKENLWIKHFFTIHEECGKNWIDFENEIKTICEDRIVLEDGIKKKKSRIDTKIKENILFDKTNSLISIDVLSNHLNILIELLNKYLLVVDQMECNCYSPNVLWFAPTNVISFNYTNTFEKIYYNDHIENSINYIDYIHGHIGDKNNIVLGFNDIDDKHIVEYSDFLKDFQMVNKDITIDSFNTIRKKYDKGSKGIYSMYFGHSLDVTDSDIIKESIAISNKVFVLYYDDMHKASLIKNLLKMYSREEFNDLCLSQNKKIIFIKQEDMIKINDISKVNNYFKCLNGMKDNTLKYLESKEYDCLNLNGDNYIQLLEILSDINDTNPIDKNLLHKINKDLYFKAFNNKNFNYFDRDLEDKQELWFGYNFDNDTGEILNPYSNSNFVYLNGDEDD